MSHGIVIHTWSSNFLYIKVPTDNLDFIVKDYPI